MSGPALGAAVQVERHRHRHHPDPDQLEEVAEPPAELHVGHQQRGHQRGGQHHGAHHNHQVGEAAGEQVGPRGAQRDQDVEGAAERQRGDRLGAAGFRHGRDQVGQQDAGGAEPTDHEQQQRLEHQQQAYGARAAQLRHRRQREHRPAHRQRGGAGEGDHAVVLHEHARRGQAVDGEQRGHGREGRAHDHRAAVAAARSHQRQRHGGERGQPGAHRDRQEVHAGGDLHFVLSHEVDQRRGHHGAGAQQGRQRDDAILESTAHPGCYRLAARTS